MTKAVYWSADSFKSIDDLRDYEFRVYGEARNRTYIESCNGLAILVFGDRRHIFENLENQPCEPTCQEWKILASVR